MADGFFERMDDFLKVIQGVALKIAKAMLWIFIVAFIAMTLYRLLGLCWRSLFSHPWGV